MRKIKWRFGLLLLCVWSLLVCAVAAEPCADGHVFDATLIRPATADAAGVRRYTCSVCGYSYEETIPATGHQWGEWITDVAPGCDAAGHRYRVCQNEASHVQEESIPALGHQYEATTSAPTCTADGATVYTCTRCGASYEETIPATGHQWGEWVTDTQPTAKREGARHRVCSYCGETLTEAIPRLPAAAVQAAPVTAPAAAPQEAPAAEPAAEPAEEPEAEPTVEPVEEPIEAPPEAAAAKPLAVSPEPVIEPAAPAPAVAEPINALDVALTGSTAVAAYGFTLLVLPYFRVLIWAKKKKKQVREEQRRG